MAAADTNTTGAARHGQLADLFQTHNCALLRFLTRRLGSPQDAKEVAQEAYVRLLQLDTLQAVNYLHAFLFKIAANLATDRVKSRSRRRLIDQRFVVLEAQPSPEAGVCAQQEMALVLEILKDLPARSRHAFVMHRLYEHDIDEVARQMSLSARCVQMHVERALLYCRDRLQQPLRVTGTSRQYND